MTTNPIHGELNISEIAQEKDNIKRAGDEIHKRIDSLTEKLNPVLTQKPPSEDKKPKKNLTIPLAIELNSYNDSLWNAVERLQELYRRIAF